MDSTVFISSLLLSLFLITNLAHAESDSNNGVNTELIFFMVCFGWSFFMWLPMLTMIWITRRTKRIQNSHLQTECFISEVVADYANDIIGMPWKLNGEFVVQSPYETNVSYLFRLQLVTIDEKTFKQINDEKIRQLPVTYVFEKVHPNYSSPLSDFNSNPSSSSPSEGQSPGSSAISMPASQIVGIDYLMGNDIKDSFGTFRFSIVCYIAALIIPIIVVAIFVDTLVLMYAIGGYAAALVFTVLMLILIKSVCCGACGVRCACSPNEMLVSDAIATAEDLRRMEGYKTGGDYLNVPKINIIGDYKSWKRRMKNKENSDAVNTISVAAPF